MTEGCWRSGMASEARWLRTDPTRRGRRFPETPQIRIGGWAPHLITTPPCCSALRSPEVINGKRNCKVDGNGGLTKVSASNKFATEDKKVSWLFASWWRVSSSCG